MRTQQSVVLPFILRACHRQRNGENHHKIVHEMCSAFCKRNCRILHVESSPRGTFVCIYKYMHTCIRPIPHNIRYCKISHLVKTNKPNFCGEKQMAGKRNKERWKRKVNKKKKMHRIIFHKFWIANAVAHCTEWIEQCACWRVCPAQAWKHPHKRQR